jgi:hypothetical protein
MAGLSAFVRNPSNSAFRRPFSKAINAGGKLPVQEVETSTTPGSAMAAAMRFSKATARGTQ